MVCGRVGQEDFFFLKQKYPFYPGLLDKLVSTLYKAVIDELRRRDSETRIETALFIDDPSHRILDDVVARFTSLARSSVGDNSAGGYVAAQPLTGSTDSLHPEVQRAPQQHPNKKGRAPTRKRSTKGAKKKEEQR